MFHIRKTHCQKWYGGHQPAAAEISEMLDSVYRRLSQNNAPDSDAANLHSGEERGSIFRISSGNSPPAFQDQESIFHQMAQPIQIAVILPLFFSVPFGRNHNLYPGSERIGNDLICIIGPVSQQRPGGYALYQMYRFFAICFGALCNQDSDWHSICVHGKMNLGVEPPFVRLMS